MDAVLPPAAAEPSVEKKEAQSILLSAGRLEAQLTCKPDHITTSSTDIVAWSIENLLAIVDSSKVIKLIHLSSPHRTQTIAIQEKPYLLTFSPRGDALFAAFRSSRTCSLWAKTDATLNSWRLSQTWTDWQGRVLDFQWLGAPRKWSARPKLHRRAARGPQFAAGEALRTVGAVAICDSGQLVTFLGNVAEVTGWVTQMKNVTIPAHKRIATAAIGLVPDEPLALVAFTMRLSSKATMPGPGTEGDALGMFFEDSDEIMALDQRQDLNYLDDDQDKIEMVELRLDVATSEVSFILRPLWPLYLSSYDSPSLPFATSLIRLLWVEADGKYSQHTSGAKMTLFGAFYSDNSTTLRSWEMQREEVDGLSEAFTKLETAKTDTVDEGREDWIAKSTNHKTYSDIIGNHFGLVPAQDRLICSWTHCPGSEALSSVTRPQLEYRLIDTETLQPLSGRAIKNTQQNQTCLPVLSPNGILAAQIANQKVDIFQASSEARWSQDPAILYAPAVIEGCNIADLVRVGLSDLPSVVAAVKLKESSFHERLRILMLGAQMKQSKQANRSRFVLELVECYTTLSGADKGSHFDHAHLWTMVSLLEWLFWLLETLARQAYVTNATAFVSSPDQTDTKSGPAMENEDGANLLALVTHEFPRKLMARCIAKAIKFRNWLHRINVSKDYVKGMMRNVQFRDALQTLTDTQQRPEGVLWSLADNLRLAEMRVNEVFIKSAVDLSQIGRLFKTYKGGEGEEGGQEEKPKTGDRWWAVLESDDGVRSGKMAKAFVEGQCITMALSLFNSPAQKSKEGGESRDVFTKARLNREAKCVTCLSCQGQTQLPLRHEHRCVCGSSAWWSIGN
ncbi:hypothetical protein CBS101457_003557 [Exobasidium rhododendri]|nr:hypothetical protein CBS101457_003557 [Exobasidium rhododendri]